MVMTSPSIFTYHCICSHLILATTRDISSLPRRKAPGLDNAIIVPLPPPPQSDESDEEDEDERDSEEDEYNGTGGEDDEGERMEIDKRPIDQVPAVIETLSVDNNVVQPGTSSDRKEAEQDAEDYTLLLSSVRDRRPCIIRREDGFEKRLLWRCGRCRLIFGYQISDEKLEQQERAEKESDSSRRKLAARRKKGYVYVLPGGLTTAEEMGSLKEQDVELVPED